MSRSDQKKVMNQSMDFAKQDNANAQDSFSSAKQASSDFHSRLNQYYLDDPYHQGGQFAQAQKTIATNRADASGNALQRELDLTTQRSGENTSGYANTMAKASRQAALDTQDSLAKAETERMGDETRYQQAGLGYSEFPADLEARLYGSSIGGRGSSMGVANDASKAKGFWDTLLDEAQKGAATGAEIAAA